MGLTHVTTQLKNLTLTGQAYEAEFLVDTGAIDCLAPASALRNAGILRLRTDTRSSCPGKCRYRSGPRDENIETNGGKTTEIA